MLVFFLDFPFLELRLFPAKPALLNFPVIISGRVQP